MLERFDRTRHDTEEVKRLLATAIGNPISARIDKLLDIVYEINGLQLYVIQDQEIITGIIGLDISASPHGWVLHLAVHPEFRFKGLARNSIRELMETLSLVSLGLETDKDRVDFYHACGFTAVEVKSKWPGVSRFRCTYGNMPEDVLEYYDRKELSF